MTGVCRTVKDSSVVAVQVFDQRKFKRKDQGFLGVVNIKVTDVLDLVLGGHGTPFIVLPHFGDGPLNGPSAEMLTLELKRSNDNLPVSGKIIIHLSTNTSTPLNNPGPSQLAGPSSLNALRENSSAVSLVPPATAGSSSNTPVASTPGGVTSDGDGGPNTEASQRSDTTTTPAATGTNEISTSSDRNFSATEDQYGPLPQGWERRTDHLGRTYYVRIAYHRVFSACKLNALPRSTISGIRVLTSATQPLTSQ